MKKEKTPQIAVRLSVFAFLLSLFLLLILMIQTVDVQTVGPENSSVGFATVNAAVHAWTGYHPKLYGITENLGWLTILLGLVPAFEGLRQLITRRSLLRVDWDLYALALCYVLLGVLYFVFEKVIINYRPVILDETVGLEASFPSSHTLLAVGIFSMLMLQIRRRIGRPFLRQLSEAVCVTILLCIETGRLLSGVHWMTDIIGGALLGATVTALYALLSAAADKMMKKFQK